MSGRGTESAASQGTEGDHLDTAARIKLPGSGAGPEMASGQVQELTLQIRALKAANKEACSRTNMLEDMDTQLRDQLEKMIHQRNQCSAEKSQRDLEIEHLRAQIYLLEADVTARHSGLDSPRTPSRDPDEAVELLHQQIEHLHSENMRLHDEVEAATAQLAELQERSEQSTAAPKAQQTSEAQPAGWSQPKAANSVQNAELKTVLSSKRDSAASQNGNSQLMTSQQVSDLSDQVAYAQQHRLGTDQDSDRKLEVIQGDLQKPSTTVAEHATKRHSEQHSSTAVAGIVHSRTAVKHSGLADDSSKHSDTVKDTKEAALLDTPVSKMQPSPMPPTAETLHLQEQLLVQKQLTEKLQGTVKKLTAELAQRPPATPSQEDLLQRVATTPLTYPTDNPAVNLSLSAVSSNVEDDDAAAEPTELLPKFQQADSMVPSVGTDRKIGQHKVSETRSATHSIHTQTDKAVTEPIPVDMVPAQAGIADTSQTSSPLQLSPPESLPSSPNAAGAQEDTMRVPGSSYKSVMHVNDSFDASDEEPVSASLSPPTMRSAVQGGTGMQDSPDASTVQQEAEEELETSDSRLELLQNQAEQQQQVLRSLFQRAEGAEHASKELQTALVRAEDTAATLQQRNNAIELVSLVTSCVAAFLAASAATVYLMH